MKKSDIFKWKGLSGILPVLFVCSLFFGHEQAFGGPVPLSNKCDMLTFSFNGLTPVVNGTIDQNNKTISLTVPYATDVSALVATFTSSPNSTVTFNSVVQVSGVTANDFSGDITYRATAENGIDYRQYLVHVEITAVEKGNSILTFKFQDFNPPVVGTINQTDKTISLKVPLSTDPTQLVATFTSSPLSTVWVGGTLQVSGTTVNDFTNPVMYTCVAQDESFEIYSVTVTEDPFHRGNDILTFGISGLSVVPAVSIDQTALTISVLVPYSTVITSLVATFTVSPYAAVSVLGAPQVSGVTPNNFTNPLIYTVTAENGVMKSYTVTVTRSAAQTGNDFLTFGFPTLVPPAVGAIDLTDKTIDLIVPYGTDITHLIATFTVSALATVKAGSVVQVSGISANDFTNPVVYHVIAEDSSDEIYTVTVTFAPNTEKKLLSFAFSSLDPPATGVIDEVNKTVSVILPYSMSRGNLVASFTHSDHATVLIGSTVQESGITVNNFTSPRIYTVKAENNSTQTYTVTVSNAPASGEALITAFRFEGLALPSIGVINQSAGTISVKIPLAVSPLGLVATFTNSAYSRVRVGTILQESGVTVNSYASPVTYIVTAENGTTKTYVVTVSFAPASTLKEVLDFRFDGLLAVASGLIDPVGKTITVSVPGESDLTRLVASFTLSPFAIAKVGGATQISGITPNDFTNPVSYSIVAEDNSETVYSVRVHAGLFVGKSILTFGFYGLDIPAESEIDEAASTILVYVPFSTNRSNLVATFSSSARSTVWIGAVQQVSGVTANNFNSVKTYSVRAENNTTREYQVIVLKAQPLDGNRILTFVFNALEPPVEGIIDEDTGSITLEVPYGTSLANLVATFTGSPYSSVSISGVAQYSGITPNDFRTPVAYRCTSESGLINEYVVTISIADPSSEKEITYFAFENLFPVRVGSIDQDSLKIKVEVTAGTDLTVLRPVFVASLRSTVTIEGKGTQVSGVSINDFSGPVIYRVVAEDGSSVNYTVIVTPVFDLVPPVVTNLAQTVTNAIGQYVVLQSNEATGRVYIIREDALHTTLAELDQSVSAGFGRYANVTQANTDIVISTALLGQGIYHTYAVDGSGNISAPGINSVSIIDVIAPDVYMQSITLSNSPTNYIKIRSSDNDGYVYLILEGVPRSTKQQLDAAVGSLRGQRSPVTNANSDVLVGTHQLYPGSYRAFAVDIHGNLSEESTSVAIITQANHLNNILGFGFNGLTPPANGQIVGSNIFISVPEGTPLGTLVAYFTLSPYARAFVGLVQQMSGITPNNFTGPVVYKIEAEDGSIQEFTVNVNYISLVTDQEWLRLTRVYPNPVSSHLTIEMDEPADRIEIINAAGQVIRDISQPRSKTVYIETGSWTMGTYLIRYYRDDRFIGVRKIIRN